MQHTIDTIASIQQSRAQQGRSVQNSAQQNSSRREYDKRVTNDAHGMNDAHIV